MRLCDMRQDIENRLSKGQNYQNIADVYGIKRGMAWQIAHGYKPGKRVSAILQLEPDSELQYTRSRRQRLNEIAREWGYAGWANYETETLKGNYEKIPQPQNRD